jgi:hypothetical protein
VSTDAGTQKTNRPALSARRTFAGFILGAIDHSQKVTTVISAHSVEQQLLVSQQRFAGFSTVERFSQVESLNSAQGTFLRGHG